MDQAACTVYFANCLKQNFHSFIHSFIHSMMIISNCGVVLQREALWLCVVGGLHWGEPQEGRDGGVAEGPAGSATLSRCTYPPSVVIG